MMRKISLAVLVMILTPMPALAGGKIVTKGKLQMTAAGEIAYPEGIRGKAKMSRRLEDNVGSTEVVLKVKGLVPGFPYASHVHAETCDSNGGGPHYQHEVGGAVDGVNEIWLNFVTDSKGKAKSVAVHNHLAREDARSVVIHQYGMTTRIACIDFK